MYRIGRARQRHNMLREALVAAVRAPVERLRRGGRHPGSGEDTIWALRDVSFEVGRGEVVGIIGRNGAGKTTLLKILSRITEPTEGRAEIRGRVGSLLEVGTGFHPELTGRENVYMSGAILGMKRAEIDRKFDEIVDFSGVEKFIDTPFKRYSSGMRVRLGFAVAAHLEPEILLVDEVLAVGDAAFRQKCLGKMGDVATGGHTVLFVSHNMAAVSTLCQRAVMLSDGQVIRQGCSPDVIDYYIKQQVHAAPTQRKVEDDRGAGYTLIKQGGETRFLCGDPIELRFEVQCPEPVSSATAGLVVYDVMGASVLGASSKFQGVHGDNSPSSRWRVRCDLGDLPLNSGRFYVSISFGNRYRDYAKFSRALSFEIVASDPFGWGKQVPKGWGYLFWRAKWRILSSGNRAAVTDHDETAK